MAYLYNFDSSYVGDLRLSRDDYKTLQEGFTLLRDDLELWNQRALDNGAARAPYQREVADLTHLIGWGEEQLAEASRQEIVVIGISVGNIRYVKAALIFVIWKREQDCARKAREAWPGAALQSIAEGIQHVRRIAERITYDASDILWEVMPRHTHLADDLANERMEWDVFISHASEDKDAIARPLADGLISNGLKVWLDELALTVGDSLRRSIDRGLAHSRFGIVIISPDFLRKEWPQKELDGLVAREADGVKVILPVWHKITASELRAYSPTLAERVAATSDKGLDYVITELLLAIRRDVQLQHKRVKIEKHTTPQLVFSNILFLQNVQKQDGQWVKYIQLLPECRTESSVEHCRSLSCASESLTRRQVERPSR
jgi:hypothetical protein